MKAITAGFVLVVLLAVGVTQSHATGSPPITGKPAELQRLSRLWMDAMVRHDRKQLEELMAPDYVLHTPDPKHPETPRSEWLDNLFNHIRIDRWDQSDISAHVYGNVGVVMSRYEWNGAFHDKPFDSKGHCTDVWRSNKNRWQVVSRTCMVFPGSVTLGDVRK